MDFVLTMEEKKCEVDTRSLVSKFAKRKQAVDYLTTVDPSLKLTREERMHMVPILCKYCSKDDPLIESLQASLVDDLTFCRVSNEKIADLSTLIYFIQRTGCSEVLPKLKEVFVEECGSIADINFNRMADH